MDKCVRISFYQHLDNTHNVSENTGAFTQVVSFKSPQKSGKYEFSHLTWGLGRGVGGLGEQGSERFRHCPGDTQLGQGQAKVKSIVPNPSAWSPFTGVSFIPIT